jgi:hypothetical protein
MMNVIAASRLRRRVDVMNERTNTTGQPENQDESTYALLIRSEEKSRNIFEVVIYPLLILGPLIAIWQFARQPVNIPAAGLKGARCVACDASAQKNIYGENFPARRGGRHPEIKG